MAAMDPKAIVHVDSVTLPPVLDTPSPMFRTPAGADCITSEEIHIFTLEQVDIFGAWLSGCVCCVYHTHTYLPVTQRLS